MIVCAVKFYVMFVNENCHVFGDFNMLSYFEMITLICVHCNTMILYMYCFVYHQNVEGVPYFWDSTRSVRPKNRQRPSIAYRLMPIAMPQTKSSQFDRYFDRKRAKERRNFI